MWQNWIAAIFSWCVTDDGLASLAGLLLFIIVMVFGGWGGFVFVGSLFLGFVVRGILKGEIEVWEDLKKS